LKGDSRVSRRTFLAGAIAVTPSSRPGLASRRQSEYNRLRDEQTGATIHQLTSHPSVNHPTYFLTSSFTPDGRHIVFTSYRAGAPHLYELEFPDGAMRQLTDGDPIHPYSASLSRDGAEVYVTRKGRIEAIRRQDRQSRVLLAIQGAQFGETALSHDGRWIVTAFKQGTANGVAIAGTEGAPPGDGILTKFPRTVIHPQFHPLDSTWVEFSGDPAPRMYRIRRDGSGLECLYEHDNHEFVVHETFLGRTGDLAFTVWPKALKRLDWKTRRITTIAEFNAWHITPNRAGSAILCDTNHPDIGLQLVDVATGKRRTVCLSKSSNGGTQWKTSRYAIAADFERARAQHDPGVDRKSALSWMEMPTDSVYGPQWTHPHPSFSHDEKMVAFTSDRSGHPQVYVVEL
jgi:oligogalacturonide lyase